MRITEAEMSAIERDSQGRRLIRVSLHKNMTLRKQYRATIPAWRRPFVGFVMSVPLVALALIGTLVMKYFMVEFLFAGSLLFLAILFTALIWGVGPALFSLILSCLALSYFFIPTIGQFTIDSWFELLQLVPFAISGLVIAIITGQRERARLHSLAIEQELETYARELEETNKSLKEANKLKDQFLSIASHEIKTPITSIRGQAQLALRRLTRVKESSSELEGTRVALEKINDQTTRLTSLVNELMDVSSIRAGKVQLHKRECELVDLCRGVVEDQRLLSGRDITFDTVTPTLLLADCDRLAQVMVNLVSNAVKYSPEGSPVRVSVKRYDSTALIEVQDYGKGIAKDHLPHIFETFYRTPDAQKSSKSGLGLGLAICKDIIERHSGRIWAESDLGKGSTFFVELPLK